MILATRQTTKKTLIRSLMFAAHLFGAAALATGCVSINLGAQKPERSSDVQLDKPSAPFEELNNKRADGAWLNRENGNSISYHSSCNDPSDPSLEVITQELFADLKNLQTLSSETTSFDGREALRTEVEGELEGIPTQVHSLVFKKNGCIYTLSYAGLKKSFPSDFASFEQFLKGFRAP